MNKHNAQSQSQQDHSQRGAVYSHSNREYFHVYSDDECKGFPSVPGDDHESTLDHLFQKADSSRERQELSWKT